MKTTHPALLDTDILSAVMRKNPMATKSARSYLIITRYEILRGLYVKASKKQLSSFDKMCANSRILPITEEIIEQAANLYADLYRKGDLISDADILIAATAIKHGLAVVTNNQKHFCRIQNLSLANWLV